MTRWFQKPQSNLNIDVLIRVWEANVNQDINILIRLPTPEFKTYYVLLIFLKTNILKVLLKQYKSPTGPNKF